MLLRIVMPFSREDRLEIMAKQIRELEVGDYEKHLLIVLDNPRISQEKIQRIFKDINFECIATKWPEEPNSHNVIQRRARITHVWNIIREYMQDKTDLVLGIEDDGNFKQGDFLTLESTFKDRYINTYCKCGFVSGVEAGRWGYKMLGAWRRKENGNMVTVPFKEHGIEQVHAAGFYFFVTTAEAIASCEGFKYNFFGPDVNFGLAMSDNDYFNFIDYSVKVGHDNSIRVIEPDAECIVLEYKKETDRIWHLIEGKV